MRLFYSPLCPWAQRARIVLARTGQACELRSVDLGARDPEFLALCPTGRVPLLEDENGPLFESFVICDYLAGKAGWRSAWAADPYLQARERLLVAQWDGRVAPAFYRSLRRPDDPGFDELSAELDFLEQTLELADDGGGELPPLLCAPHWVRMQWLDHRSGLASFLGARPRLRAWLDRAAAAPEVVSTLPDRAEMIAHVERKFAPSA
ncbi:MAG: glutathione S-transferase [Planctomycetota bacterium]|nr:MAG: glutathione S-transferase [Planctomycetota bacterium]